jgi:Fe-S cluster assembly ATPase SufC
MLRLQNVTFTVPQNEKGGKNTILDDVTLDIEDGSYVVVTGPNGGGKTTLAKVIMGLVKPDSGRIFLDGMDISSLDVTARSEAGISYGFQQPPRFKGHHRPRPSFHCGKAQAEEGRRLPPSHQGRSVRHRIYQPRSGHFPVRR